MHDFQFLVKHLWKNTEKQRLITNLIGRNIYVYREIIYARKSDFVRKGFDILENFKLL